MLNVYLFAACGVDGAPPCVHYQLLLSIYLSIYLKATLSLCGNEFWEEELLEILSSMLMCSVFDFHAM